MRRWLLLFLITFGLAACQTFQPLPTIIPFSPEPPTNTLVPIEMPTTGDIPTATPPEVLIPTFIATSTLTATSMPLPTATITNTPTITPTFRPLEVRYDGIYSIPAELRSPILEAMKAELYLLPDEGQWVVSAYRAIPGWAKIVLVPQRFVDASWEHIETLSNYIVEVVAYEDKPHQWQAFLLNGVVGQGIQDEIPQNFVDVISSLPDLAGEYRFPWMARQGWWAVQGWHGGNAIDFQPAYEVGYSVVAVESGYLREVCRDGYQSLLQITHADGNVTYYLHVQPSRTLRNTLLDHSVQRGQYLGELTRNPPFNYACGQGLSRHLHFVSSNPHLIVQGHDLSNIAEIATCCRDVPIFVSENERVN